MWVGDHLGGLWREENIERLSRRPPTGEAPSSRPPTAFPNYLDHHGTPAEVLAVRLRPADDTKIPDRVKLSGTVGSHKVVSDCSSSAPST